MEGKWIYLVLLLAYYAWSAYSSQKKKREEELNKKQPPANTPKRHYNPTPASGNIQKSLGDLYKNILGEEILSKPVKTQPAKKETKNLTIKANPAVTVFEEGGSSIILEETNTLQQEGLALPQYDTIPFNAREAFIGSIIWNRPEY